MRRKVAVQIHISKMELSKVQKRYNYHKLMSLFYQVKLEEISDPAAAPTTLIGRMWKNRLLFETCRMPLDPDDPSERSVDEIEADFIKTLTENCDAVIDPNSRFCREVEYILEHQPAAAEEEVQSRLSIPIIDLTNEAETSKVNGEQNGFKGKGKKKGFEGKGKKKMLSM